MYKIKTPATSANVGPGFDCLGIAWNLYNTFYVELSEQDELLNTPAEYYNAENLFLRAFHAGASACGHGNAHIRMREETLIPVARGLGSSASLIVGGLAAASVLLDDTLSNSEILSLATEIEGHPDNIAPCLLGGFTAASVLAGKTIARKLALADTWKYTLFIAPYESSTAKARSILPASYSRADASANISHVVLTCKALEDGDQPLLHYAAQDRIHEPYRSTLIPEYADLKACTEQDTGGKFLISGSGSTCLLISQAVLSAGCRKQLQERYPGWQILSVSVAANGCEIWGEGYE